MPGGRRTKAPAFENSLSDSYNTAEMAFARLNRHAPLDPKYCSETNSLSIVQNLTGFGIPTIKL